MENINFNSQYWDGFYDWKGAGEEWSEMWGGSRAQWLGSLYPRISAYLPSETILEIAPGFGRWTQFLLSGCKRFVGVDLSLECVDACIERFSGVDHAIFVKNDGKSLEIAESGSVDFLFSFDSLVHANLEVMQAYAPEILRVLSPNGAAFIHHSNWLEVGDEVENPHGRGSDMSAELFAEAIKDAGGHVYIQEKINWGLPGCSDCLTLFGWKNKEPTFIRNEDFMLEGNNICKYQSPYSKISR